MNLNVRALIRRVRVPRKVGSHVELVRPPREWLTGLLCAGLLFLGSSAFAGVLFFKSLKNLEEGPKVEAGATEAYARGPVLQALKIYRGKQSAFDALRNSRAPVDESSEKVAPSPDAAPDEEEGKDTSSASTSPPVAQ